MTGTEQVKLMPDYGAAWPLWGGGGMCDAEELGLSPALAARLRAWQDLFDEHFSYDGGWDGPSAQERFATLARQLVRDLEAELPGTTVVLDDWTGSVSRPRRR
ncbi:hypothetical protein [Geodermatophilus maliterrae]|uniref:Uncharacterized protein n=1 Tax=Geodermatophilus maliterrae TaxID=3162531 RepID=A0ABV3XI35_9ACTN